MSERERVEDAEFLRNWADGIDEQVGYECVNAARMRRIADTLLQPEGEPVGMEVWVPSHWLNTLMAHPNWIVGMTLEPDDTEEWIQVTILTPPSREREAMEDLIAELLGVLGLWSTGKTASPNIWKVTQSVQNKARAILGGKG